MMASVMEFHGTLLITRKPTVHFTVRIAAAKSRNVLCSSARTHYTLLLHRNVNALRTHKIAIRYAYKLPRAASVSRLVCSMPAAYLSLHRVYRYEFNSTFEMDGSAKPVNNFIHHFWY